MIIPFNLRVRLPDRDGGIKSLLGGVDGGPCAAVGGFEVLLFFFGLLGEPGEFAAPPGLKSAVRLVEFAI